MKSHDSNENSNEEIKIFKEEEEEKLSEGICYLPLGMFKKLIKLIDYLQPYLSPEYKETFQSEFLIAF